MRLAVLNFSTLRMRLKRHHHIHTDKLGGILASKQVRSWMRSGRIRRRRCTHSGLDWREDIELLVIWMSWSCATFVMNLCDELVLQIWLWTFWNCVFCMLWCTSSCIYVIVCFRDFWLGQECLKHSGCCTSHAKHIGVTGAGFSSHESQSRQRSRWPRRRWASRARPIDATSLAKVLQPRRCSSNHVGSLVWLQSRQMHFRPRRSSGSRARQYGETSHAKGPPGPGGTMTVTSDHLAWLQWHQITCQPRRSSGSRARQFGVTSCAKNPVGPIRPWAVAPETLAWLTSRHGPPRPRR
jgi:hypothetical protein